MMTGSKSQGASTSRPSSSPRPSRSSVIHSDSDSSKSPKRLGRRNGRSPTTPIPGNGMVAEVLPGIGTVITTDSEKVLIEGCYPIELATKESWQNSKGKAFKGCSFFFVFLDTSKKSLSEDHPWTNPDERQLEALSKLRKLGLPACKYNLSTTPEHQADGDPLPVVNHVRSGSSLTTLDSTSTKTVSKERAKSREILRRDNKLSDDNTNTGAKTRRTSSADDSVTIEPVSTDDEVNIAPNRALYFAINPGELSTVSVQALRDRAEVSATKNDWVVVRNNTGNTFQSSTVGQAMMFIIGLESSRYVTRRAIALSAFIAFINFPLIPIILLIRGCVRIYRIRKLHKTHSTNSKNYLSESSVINFAEKTIAPPNEVLKLLLSQKKKKGEEIEEDSDSDENSDSDEDYKSLDEIATDIGLSDRETAMLTGLFGNNFKSACIAAELMTQRGAGDKDKRNQVKGSEYPVLTALKNYYNFKSSDSGDGILNVVVQEKFSRLTKSGKFIRVTLFLFLVITPVLWTCKTLVDNGRSKALIASSIFVPLALLLIPMITYMVRGGGSSKLGKIAMIALGTILFAVCSIVGVLNIFVPDLLSKKANIIVTCSFVALALLCFIAIASFLSIKSKTIKVAHELNISDKDVSKLVNIASLHAAHQWHAVGGKKNSEEEVPAEKTTAMLDKSCVHRGMLLSGNVKNTCDEAYATDECLSVGNPLAVVNNNKTEFESLRDKIDNYAMDKSEERLLDRFLGVCRKFAKQLSSLSCTRTDTDDKERLLDEHEESLYGSSGSLTDTDEGSDRSLIVENSLGNGDISPGTNLFDTNTNPMENARLRTQSQCNTQ